LIAEQGSCPHATRHSRRQADLSERCRINPRKENGGSAFYLEVPLTENRSGGCADDRLAAGIDTTPPPDSARNGQSSRAVTARLLGLAPEKPAVRRGE
jgi:hypothetical protein